VCIYFLLVIPVFVLNLFKLPKYLAYICYSKETTLSGSLNPLFMLTLYGSVQLPTRRAKDMAKEG